MGSQQMAEPTTLSRATYRCVVRVIDYTLADGLGSTTQLTDSTGEVTDSYSYDVFGAPRTTTGTTANDFRYTGQQRDGNANR